MTNGFPTDTSHFKLIFSDFDGTLAGNEHIVTPKVVNAVRRWIDSGRHFSIATGRQYLMLEDECKKMGLTTPVVVRGGAEVVDPRNGQILHSEFIQKNEVKIILDLIVNSNLFFYGIEIDDIIYSNFKIEVPFPKITFKKLSEFELKNVPKIHLRPMNERSSDQNQFIKEIGQKLPGIHSIATHNDSFGRGWDITSVKATKLHGIVKVLEYLHLERKDVVGVGDSYNDFPLLEAAGLKVAMGNANSELKEIADVIVSTNEENGVAYLIDNLLK